MIHFSEERSASSLATQNRRSEAARDGPARARVSGAEPEQCVVERARRFLAKGNGRVH